MTSRLGHRLRALTRLAVILLLGVTSAAQTAFSDSPGPEPAPRLSVEVVTTGRATVLDGDRTGARDRALQDALLRAVEQGLGTRIEASTMIAGGELIDRRLRIETNGWVRDYTIEDEGLAGNELWVRVRARLLEQPPKSALGDLIDVPVALFVSATGVQADAVLGQVRSELTNSMSGAEIIDSSLLATLTRGDESRTPSAALVRSLASSAGFGLLLLATLDVRPMSTEADTIGYAVRPDVTRPVAAARGTLSMISGITGDLIWTKTFRDIRGSAALELETAARRAGTALAKSMRTALVGEAAAELRTRSGRLRVRVGGSTTPQQLEHLIAALRSTRWINAVEILAVAQDESVLELVSPVRARVLLEQLRGSRELVVDRFDARTGELFVSQRPAL